MLKVGSEQSAKIRGLTVTADHVFCAKFQLLKSLSYFRDGWHFDFTSTPDRVAYVLADCSNIGPKMFGLFKETRVGFHLTEFSHLRTRSTNEIPTALQIRRNSTKSKTRSPNSYLLTNDWGWPRRFAKSLCVSPASTRTCRSSF